MATTDVAPPQRCRPVRRSCHAYRGRGAQTASATQRHRLDRQSRSSCRQATPGWRSHSDPISALTCPRRKSQRPRSGGGTHPGLGPCPRHTPHPHQPCRGRMVLAPAGTGRNRSPASGQGTGRSPRARAASPPDLCRPADAGHRTDTGRIGRRLGTPRARSSSGCVDRRALGRVRHTRHRDRNRGLQLSVAIPDRCMGGTSLLTDNPGL